MYPKIYLSIDNCFASKRWTEPHEWMEIIRDLGLSYVEASADTECDPLYGTPEYLEDWVRKLKDASNRTGVIVSQFYSGHGTYSTLGLSHTDERVGIHMLENWLFPMCEISGQFNANLGFFCHAFPQSVLHDPQRYYDKTNELYFRLGQVAKKALASGCTYAAVEQMYSPNQVPWTIEGAKRLIKSIFTTYHTPFYLTIDVGHQVGQIKYLKMDSSDGERPYLYATQEDCLTQSWLEQLGCYSPIIHLQQTDGLSSRHLAFTQANNKYGVVKGGSILSSLRRSFEQSDEPDMPPRVDKIYLTLEIFTSAADRSADIIDGLRQSVDYWRQFVPIDGLTLDKLIL